MHQRRGQADLGGNAPSGHRRVALRDHEVFRSVQKLGPRNLGSLARSFFSRQSLVSKLELGSRRCLLRCRAAIAKDQTLLTRSRAPTRQGLGQSGAIDKEGPRLRYDCDWRWYVRAEPKALFRETFCAASVIVRFSNIKLDDRHDFAVWQCGARCITETFCVLTGSIVGRPNALTVYILWRRISPPDRVTVSRILTPGA